MRNKNFLARLLDDWPAKILSLAAALLLFFFYRLNRLEDRYLSLPLSVAMNEEYVPASQYPRSVRVTLRGESNDVFSIQEEDLVAVLDLSGERGEGVVKAPVQIEKKGSALGVDPLEILVEPSEIAVGIERKVSRVVPVTPSFRGYLEPGYELLSFDFAPAEVEIAGPASAVARVDDVSTDPIELAGRKEDFAVKARLARKDPLVLVVGSETVEFSAVIQKSLAVKNFEGLEIAALGLAETLELAEPLPAGSLRLQSSKADLRGYEPAAASLSVDFSALRRPGTYTLPVVAALPPDFAVDSYEPQTVTVVLRAAARKESSP